MSVVTSPEEAQAKAPEKAAAPNPPATGRASDMAFTDLYAGEEKPRRRVPAYVFYLATLALGLVIGGWVVHRHDKAQVVIASVNGTVIDKDQFFHRLQVASGPAVMHQLVAEDLQLQFAKKEGVAPTAADLDARYQEASNRPGFDDYLSTHDLSPRDYRRSLELQLAQVNVATKGVEVSDAEVKDFYRANIDKNNPQAQFYMPETTQVEVIVTSTESQSEQAYQELTRYTPFDIVARKYSSDSARDNGGLLPPLQRGRTKFNHMPGLENAIFSLKIDEQTGPTQFGSQWWIIRCLDKAPETTLPFSAVKADCVIGAKMKKAVPLRGKLVQEEFEKFQRDADIRAFWSQYDAAVKTD